MNDQPKFCPNCGQAWEPGSRFCGGCGQAFQTVTASEEPQAVPAMPEVPAKESVEKKQKPFKWRGPIIIFGILIVGLGLAYAGYVTDFFGLGPARKELSQARAPEPLSKKAKPVSGKKPANAFDKANLSKYVTSVRFFESNSPVPPPIQRIYKNDFSIYEARFINWELNLQFPTTNERIAFTIEAVWRRPDGSIHTKEAINTYIEPGWNNSWHVSGWGSNMPGTWLPGEYMVELYVEGKKITQAGFKIF